LPDPPFCEHREITCMRALLPTAAERAGCLTRSLRPGA
jgi:hypothetical protein